MATGRLAKTDSLHAETIALFAERLRPHSRPVPEPQAVRFVELVARRQLAQASLSAGPVLAPAHSPRR